MATQTDPKPPSTVVLVLLALGALLLLWQIFGRDEMPSPTLATIQWVFLLLILAVLGYGIWKRSR